MVAPSAAVLFACPWPPRAVPPEDGITPLRTFSGCPLAAVNAVFNTTTLAELDVFDVYADLPSVQRLLSCRMDRYRSLARFGAQNSSYRQTSCSPFAGGLVVIIDDNHTFGVKYARRRSTQTASCDALGSFRE